MGAPGSKAFADSEVAGPVVQLHSLFHTNAENREAFKGINTQFLDSTREHHVSEQNVCYRVADKEGSLDYNSGFEAYYCASDVPKHGIHVAKMMGELAEHKVEIAWSAIEAPAGPEADALHVAMGQAIHTYLDSAFTRPKAIRECPHFIHILSGWTVKEQDKLQEVVTGNSTGGRGQEDEDYEAGQIFYGASRHEDSVLVSEGYTDPAALKGHLDKVAAKGRKMGTVATGKWCYVYVTEEHLKSLKKLLGDGWLMRNGFYQSPEFFKLDPRSFALDPTK